MRERFQTIDFDDPDEEIVKLDLAGLDDPKMVGYYHRVFGVAGKIQPFQPAYPTAQKILDLLESCQIENITHEQWEEVVVAAGTAFIKIDLPATTEEPSPPEENAEKILD